MDVGGLIEHDQIIVPLLRGEDTFAVVNEPVQLGARRDDLAKGGVKH